jgi:uncharacterized protein YjiS (DUF1127 family)
MFATFRLPRMSRIVSAALFPPAIGLGAAARRQWRRYAEARRQHRAMILLDSLSDGALKDIGVSRAEIPSMARHGRPRRATTAPYLPRR